MFYCQPSDGFRVYSRLGRLSGALFAPRCLLCDGRGQAPCVDLCTHCERGLPRLPARCCIRCNAPVETDGVPALCPACRGAPLSYLTCRAAFRYADPVDGLVKELKYRGRLIVARVLGELLAAQVAVWAAEPGENAVDSLLPVPLHSARLSERGFNQSLEIARWSARRLGLPLEPRLASRLRDTVPQAGLSARERSENLLGAFAATAAARGRHIALVDDVVTTGATVQALSAVLLGAGAASVRVYCVARVLEAGRDGPTRAGAGVRLSGQKDRSVRA